MSERVLVLAIDGADPSLLSQWAQAGHLPTLQRMLESGFSSPLQGPVGFGDAPTWATAHTGVSPAHHGRYSYRQLRKGSYQKALTVDADLKAEPYWMHLSRAGKRVAILDMPKSPVPNDLNGIFLGDWLVHGREHAGPVSYPENFARDIIQQIGAPPPSMCGLDQPALDEIGYRRMLERLFQSVSMKRDLVLSVLDQENWDLVAAGFKEAHCIGHHGWHLHDRGRPEFVPDIAAALGDPLLRVYKAIDVALAEILERAGPEATVLVYSPLGMGPHYGAFRLLPDILAGLGYGGGGLVRAGRRALGALAGPPKKAATQSGMPRDGSTLRSKIKDVFEARRDWLSIDLSEHVSGLRINLKGREPKGRIRLADRDRCEDQLIADFEALRDPVSGIALVDRILRTRDHYSGPYLQLLPDLLVYWNMTQPVVSATSPRLGTIRSTRRSLRTGAHRDGGILMSTGPHIGRESSTEAIDLRCIAATIASLLGVDFESGETSPIGAVINRPA
ncbi:MAG: alkaline phosphatase family protein [Alphaproteobacteria bacterium]